MPSSLSSEVKSMPVSKGRRDPSASPFLQMSGKAVKKCMAKAQSPPFFGLF